MSDPRICRNSPSLPGRSNLKAEPNYRLRTVLGPPCFGSFPVNLNSRTAAVSQKPLRATSWGFEFPRRLLRPVSGHRGHLSQDIVGRPAASEGLVGAERVDGERSDEIAVLGYYADVGAGDEESDLAVLCTTPTGMRRSRPR